MWEQTLAIFIVLVLLISSLWLLRRKGFAVVNLGFASGVSSAKRMELVERMALTPHHSLHLVRVEDRMILIGVSPQSCVPVDSFSAFANTAGLSSGKER
jgi:flagellar biogenesis protein FliO